MVEERMVEAASVRSLIDGLKDVMGAKATSIVLNYAELGQYVDNPPPLDEKAVVPASHGHAINVATIRVFGVKGSRALLIAAGEAVTRRMFEGMPALMSGMMRMLPSGVKKKSAFRLLVSESEKHGWVTPQVHYEKHKIVISFPGCDVCEGIETDRPVCAFTEGLLSALAEQATRKPHRAKEIECKALGHESCVYEVFEL